MKEHVEVIKDSFEDFAGKTHHYVIAAVSVLVYDSIGYLGDNGDISIEPMTKGLSLGISICNPEDEFNEELGVLKAVGRAKKSIPVIYTSKSGLINTKTVRALLEQESEFLKNNPEKFIKGYEDAKSRHERNIQANTLKNNFNELENKVVEAIKDNPKFLDNVTQYLKLMKNVN